MKNQGGAMRKPTLYDAWSCLPGGLVTIDPIPLGGPTTQSLNKEK